MIQLVELPRTHPGRLREAVDTAPRPAPQPPPPQDSRAAYADWRTEVVGLVGSRAGSGAPSGRR